MLGVQLHPSGRLLRLRWGGGALAPVANLDDVLVALQEQRAERDLPWPSKVGACATSHHRTIARGGLSSPQLVSSERYLCCAYICACAPRRSRP